MSDISRKMAAAIACSAAFLLVFGAMASARQTAQQHDGSLDWQGTIDGAVRIHITYDKVVLERRGGNEPRGIFSTLHGVLPRREQKVHLEHIRGRGRITIHQQPSSKNNYAAEIDIDDRPYDGETTYKIRVTWSGGGDSNNGGTGKASSADHPQ